MGTNGNLESYLVAEAQVGRRRDYGVALFGAWGGGTGSNRVRRAAPADFYASQPRRAHSLEML